MLVDGEIFVKNRIPISNLEYSSIGSPRSNGMIIFSIIVLLFPLLLSL